MLLPCRKKGKVINDHQLDYDYDSVNSIRAFITKSAILVLPQTQKIAGGKISGFETKQGKTVYTTKLSGNSKVFGFEVPTLNSGFKISGDTTKPGVLILFRIRPLVNVCKRQNQFGTKTFRIRHKSGTMSCSENLV